MPFSRSCFFTSGDSVKLSIDSGSASAAGAAAVTGGDAAVASVGSTVDWSLAEEELVGDSCFVTSLIFFAFFFLGCEQRRLWVSTTAHALMVQALNQACCVRATVSEVTSSFPLTSVAGVTSSVEVLGDWAASVFFRFLGFCSKPLLAAFSFLDFFTFTGFTSGISRRRYKRNHCDFALCGVPNRVQPLPSLQPRWYEKRPVLSRPLLSPTVGKMHGLCAVHQHEAWRPVPCGS